MEIFKNDVSYSEGALVIHTSKISQNILYISEWELMCQQFVVCGYIQVSRHLQKLFLLIMIKMGTHQEEGRRIKNVSVTAFSSRHQCSVVLCAGLFGAASCDHDINCRH